MFYIYILIIEYNIINILIKFYKNYYMGTKKIDNYNLEEAYRNFVNNKIKTDKERSGQVTPDYMYEQCFERKRIIYAVEDLCYTFKTQSTFIFQVFNDWIISGNTKISKERLEAVFNILEDFSVFLNSESGINHWREEINKECDILDKIEVYNLNADEIISDKKLLKKINNKINK